MNMIPLAFFAPGHGIYWLIAVLIVIVIYKWKALQSTLLAILILPFYLPYVLFVKCIGADIAFAIKRRRKRRKWKKQRELQQNNPK